MCIREDNTKYKRWFIRYGLSGLQVLINTLHCLTSIDTFFFSTKPISFHIVSSHVSVFFLLYCMELDEIYPNHMQEQLSLHGILWIDKRKNPIYFSFTLFITSTLHMRCLLYNVRQTILCFYSFPVSDWKEQ